MDLRGKKITVHDMTLRDGMHPKRHLMTLDQMVSIATGLDQAGVPLIEVTHGDGLGGSSVNYGFPAHTDEEYLGAVIPKMKQAKISALLLPGIGTVDHLKMARDLGVHTIRVATHCTEIYTLSLHDALPISTHCTEADVSEQHITMARKLEMDTVGFLMMAHMNSAEGLVKQAKLMESYGANCIYVTDSAGHLLPDGVKERLAAVRLFDPAGLLGNELQRLFPGGLHQGAVFADQGMREPFGMAGGVKAEEPLGAEIAVVASGAVGGVDLDQLIGLGLDGDLAAVAAIAADRLGAFQHPGPVFIHGQAAGDGADRADLHAAAAEFAIQWMGAEVFDLRHGSAADRSERLHVHDFIAVADAAEALHATIHLRFDQRAEVFFLENALRFGEPARRCGVLMGEVLQVALPALVADGAVQRMIRENEFQHGFMGVVHDGRGGADAHALGDRCAAGRLELGHLFHFHQTHAAVGVRLELGVIAEVRNHRANTPRGLDQQRAFRHTDGVPIDRHPNCFR